MIARQEGDFQTTRSSVREATLPEWRVEDSSDSDIANEVTHSTNMMAIAAAAPKPAPACLLGEQQRESVRVLVSQRDYTRPRTWVLL